MELRATTFKSSMLPVSQIDGRTKITLADLQFLSQLVVIVRIFHERVLHDRVGTYKQRNSRRHESL